MSLRKLRLPRFPALVFAAAAILVSAHLAAAQSSAPGGAPSGPPAVTAPNMEC